MKDVLEIKGIKCDNDSCDYEDHSVTKHQYKEYLNKPCPKCGSNLLTEADMKTVRILDLVFNNIVFKLINAFFGLFSKNKAVGTIDMDGSGKFEVNVIEQKK